MRISDWSSDVCSSDLVGAADRFGRIGLRPVEEAELHRPLAGRPALGVAHDLPGEAVEPDGAGDRGADQAEAEKGDPPEGRCISHRHSTAPAPAGARSEEHTSELQSLMRISYAVFCLKNKNKQTQNTN